MGLDIQKLMNAPLQLREAEIAVPELTAFFPKGEKPVWVVRQLTGAELGRAREATENADKLKALVTAMAGDGDKAEAIRSALGLSEDEVPGDVSRRIEMLAAGSVNPKIGHENRDLAVLVAEKYSITFYTLTNKIQELTGQGAEVGKPKRSGVKPAPESP